MHAPRAALSHHPMLQDSVNVRLWERGFILERHDIFAPFITASVSLTHWHKNTWYVSESKIGLSSSNDKNVSDKTLDEMRHFVEKAQVEM